MKKKIGIIVIQFMITGLLLLLAGCQKDENSSVTVTDKDGNVYSSVSIGTQVWMKENLKTTKYNDGTQILNITDLTEWQITTSAGYVWYDNDIGNKSIYGALYNWYSINTYKLCPTGWHVPTLNEWLTLIDYLGGVDVAGGKLKEKGTSHWLTPNTNATDDYGFTALPGGTREYNAAFNYREEIGYWWTATPNTSGEEYASHFSMSYNDLGAYYHSHQWTEGLSVRCVKD